MSSADSLKNSYVKCMIEVLSCCRLTAVGLETTDYSELIKKLKDSLLDSRKKDRRVYYVGNGGSAGIALHMATDFQKNGRMKTQTFFDPTLLTCMANDYGYEYVFSKPLGMHAEQDDVLIAISSSGKSPNIINAVSVAKEKRCKVITFSGFAEDNPLRMMGDLNVYVPSFEYGIVESIHNLILQQIVDEIKSGDERE